MRRFRVVAVLLLLASAAGLGAADAAGAFAAPPAPQQSRKVSSAAASRSALAWWRRGPHSRVLGTALASVTEPYLGKHRLMGLVSLDLAGGLTNAGGPSTGTLGLDNFIVAFVDAQTGQVKTTTAGKSNLLPPLPVIRG